MNIFNRVFIKIKRQWFSTVVKFFVIFTVSTALTSFISLNRGIAFTETLLINSMKPVAILQYCAAVFWGGCPDADPIPYPYKFFSQDAVYAVSNLPQVAHFDYTIDLGTNSKILENWHPDNTNPTFNQYHLDYGYPFTVRGTSHTEFMDLTFGIVEMVNGNSFTIDQLTNNEHVVVMSRLLAEKNQLSIGDSIELIVYTSEEIGGGGIDLISFENLSFEVIGFFDVVGLNNHTFNNNPLNWSASEARAVNVANRLYIPNGIVKETSNALNYDLFIREEKRLNAQGIVTDGIFEERYFMRPVFVLNDPTEIISFREDVYQLLGGQIHVSDGLHRFAPISNVMETMKTFSSQIMTISFVFFASILIITNLLFFRDQRYEFGIYISLGERKRVLWLQFLIETLLITTLAITLSLFSGSFIVNYFSNQQLDEKITNIIITPRQSLTIDDVEPWEMMGLPVAMSGEEMISYFDLSLSFQTIVLIYGSAMLIVISFTALPITVLLASAPTKIILDAKEK